METVNPTKLLGTIITNDLKWDSNVNNIAEKVYARMELLRKLVKFKPPKKDLKQVYIAYLKSLLEQSCTVWHSGLTYQNSNDLERVQKVALRLILNDQFKNYDPALVDLDLEKLSSRREKLCLASAQKCLKNPKI